MNIELTNKQFRRLLDLVYIGNWVINSIRGGDRITDYDEVESKLFGECLKNRMEVLVDIADGRPVPSRAFVEGGIHEAIMDYEDSVFFEILAEELARRDIQMEGLSEGDAEEVNRRINEYISEFEKNGIDNIIVNM
ncbi:MAG: hypothetical protein GX193_01085 [Clostridiales bacterium]|nr:hypothetical protein [Clostridiales bacterium]